MVSPLGISVGPDGTLYIGQGGRVRRVGPDGIIKSVPGTTGGSIISTGITYGPNGTLYIADVNSHRIRSLSSVLPGFAQADVVVASDDGTQLYEFDDIGRHLRTLDTSTGATLYAFAYDAAGWLIGITDRDGEVTSIERDGVGNPLAIVAPDGQRTTLTTNAEGYLASVTNPAGEQIQIGYGAGGLLMSFTNAREFTSQYTYDSVGRLRTAMSPDGGSQMLARGELQNGYEVTRTTALGRVTTYRVENPSVGGQKRTTFFPDGTRTIVDIAFDGRTTITHPDGSMTTKVEGPDPRFGMQASVAQSSSIRHGSLTANLQSTRTVQLADPSNPLSLTTLTDTANLNGRTTTTTYTAATRTHVSTSPMGRTVTTILDEKVRPVSVQVPGFADVVMSYDPRGRLASFMQMSGSDSRIASMTYGSDGNLGSVTDSLGRVVGLLRDPVGRVTQQSLPGNREISFDYDANGNLISLTPPDRPAHLFTYSNRDLTASYTPPSVPGGGATVYSYNVDRQPSAFTRPDGKIVSFAYDGVGRLATLGIDRGQYGFEYSPTTSQLVRITDPQGGALAYEFAGPLVTRVSRTGEAAGSVGVTYDNSFRPTALNVNGANPISFAYDADDLLTVAGAMSLTRNSSNGLLVGTTLGTVTDVYSYNAFGEVTSYVASSAGSRIYEVVYTHDPLGRITQKLETIDGVTTTWNYAYESAGQLQEVTKNGTVAATYTYDANGNRLSKSGPGIAETGTYDDQDRLLSYAGATYTYSANGELATKTVGGEITTYQYDELGNLIQALLPDGTQIDYVIDGQNRRVGRKVNGTLVQGFLYQGQLAPIAELDAAGNVVARFVYGTRANVPDYMIRGGITYRVVADRLGSPRLIVNTTSGEIEQRADYDEFGVPTIVVGSSAFQPFGFAGGILDSDTRLVRFGARDYDATSGRWTSKDPILFDGNQTDLYAYAGSDPLNARDPSGKASVGFGFGLEGAAVGGQCSVSKQLVVDTQGEIAIATTTCCGGVTDGFSIGVSTAISYNEAEGVSDLRGSNEGEMSVDTSLPGILNPSAGGTWSPGSWELSCGLGLGGELPVTFSASACTTEVDSLFSWNQFEDWVENRVAPRPLFSGPNVFDMIDLL